MFWELKNGCVSKSRQAPDIDIHLAGSDFGITYKFLVRFGVRAFKKRVIYKGRGSFT